MEKIFLGFDTSNYRTSAAAVGSSGEVLFERAELLDVKKGERGLRQSEAFFSHSNRLPDQISGLFETIDSASIAAIGVSERPRRVRGSYMPCFLAGVNAARELGAALGVPVYRFSHQEGHAAAVLGDEKDRVLFMHLSGGTTEFLICQPDDKGYDMQIAGGTKDISIGQLIDRVGVALGYPFPSGSYLDDTAYRVLEEADFDIPKKKLPHLMPKIKLSADALFNMSGAETKLLRCIEGGIPAAEVPKLTAELFISITDLLAAAAYILSERHGIEKVYMAGGVASSRSFRRLIENKGCRADIRFGEPALSGDNAVGTALLAKRIYETGKCITGK